MGTKWTVNVFSPADGDQEFWRGESGIAAMWNAIKAKRLGYKCIVVEWRP